MAEKKSRTLAEQYATRRQSAKAGKEAALAGVESQFYKQHPYAAALMDDPARFAPPGKPAVNYLREVDPQDPHRIIAELDPATGKPAFVGPPSPPLVHPTIAELTHTGHEVAMDPRSGTNVYSVTDAKKRPVKWDGPFASQPSAPVEVEGLQFESSKNPKTGKRQVNQTLTAPVTTIQVGHPAVADDHPAFRDLNVLDALSEWATQQAEGAK